MSLLAWRQNEAMELEFWLPSESGTRIFVAGTEVINFLVSVKQAEIFIRLVNEEERVFRAHFRGLKAVAEPEKGSLIRTLDDGVSSLTGAYFAVSRGENFSERWLHPGRWDRERYWFDLRQKITAVKEVVVQPEGLSGSIKAGQKADETVAAPAQTVPAVPGTGMFLFSIMAIVACTGSLLLTIEGFGSAYRHQPFWLEWAAGLTFVSALVAALLFIRMVYLSWKLQSGRADVLPPDVAAWLLVIPLYQVIWMHRSVPELVNKLALWMEEVRAAQAPPRLKPVWPLIMVGGAGISTFFLFLGMINQAFGGSQPLVWALFFLFFMLLQLALLITGRYLARAFRVLSRESASFKGK